MTMRERPDLSNLPDDVRDYINALEAEIEQLRGASGRGQRTAAAPLESAPASEPPGTLSLITLSRSGQAKRTPRHLYGRQRRGGMGVFDIDLPEDDAPVCLAQVEAGGGLLFFTANGRVYRMPAAELDEAAVRARGQQPAVLPSHERVVAVLPDTGGQYVALLSQRGWARRVRASYLGKSLIQGTIFHDVKEGGPLAAACWTNGNEELFIASREGKGIRFDETQVPARGCLGMRLDITDAAVAITAVRPDSGVFLLGADGLGTIRLMAGFAANKAPGAGGKVAMKCDNLVGAACVAAGDDIAVISRLGKIIRFAADEVPPKEGVVQGVACISLRADEAVAMVVMPPAAAAD